MKQKDIEQLAIDTYLDNTDKLADVRKAWKKLEDRYENRLRRGSITADTTVKAALGAAFSLVENAIPRLVSREPRYRYAARGREDTEASELYQEFSDYQWDEAECQRKVKEVVKEGLIEGLAGLKMGWKTETIIKSERKKPKVKVLGVEITNVFAPSEPTVTEETVMNYTVDLIRADDLIWNLDAPSPEKALIKGHKETKIYKQLKQDGYNVRRLGATIRNTDSLWDGETREKRNRNPDYVDVEVVELYVKTLDDKNRWQSHVVTLASSQHFGQPLVIGFEPNPYDMQFDPLLMWRPITRPGKLYGIGIIEANTGIIDAEEDMLNMALENLWTTIATPLMYDPALLHKPNELKFKPRTLIPTKGGDTRKAVQPLPTPQLPELKFYFDYLIRAKQNTSGITDFQTGGEQIKGAKTLGEIQIKTQESNSRLAMMLDSLEKEILEPMGKMALWMNQQFLADDDKREVIFRIVGKKGRMMEKNIKFKDIEAVKDVRIVGGSSSLVMQESEIQKWSLLLNQASQEVGLGPRGVPINRETIWERLIENGYQEKDVENFLPSLKEREQEGVKTDKADMKDAKEENLDPGNARVMPADNPNIHIPLHNAALRAQGTEDTQYTPEQLQALTAHRDDHVRQTGGAVPAVAQGMEQANVNQVMQPNVEQAGKGTQAGGGIPQG